MVIHIAGLPGRNRQCLLHILVMQHKLKGAVCAQLKNGICPEPGAGAGGIEVEGCGIVCIIQRDSIALSIQQTGNAGEEGVGLAIAGSGEGE